MAREKRLNVFLIGWLRNKPPKVQKGARGANIKIDAILYRSVVYHSVVKNSSCENLKF